MTKMTIQEAIEIQTNYNHTLLGVARPEIIEAQKLLIEAGKRVKWHKKQHLEGFYELLPGEEPE